MTVQFDDGTQISIAPGDVSPMGIDMIVSWGYYSDHATVG